MPLDRPPEEDAQPASTGEQQALERKKIFLAAGEYARLRVRKDTTTQNILEEESFSYNAVGEMISRTLTIGKTVRPPPMPMKWGAICTR